MVSIELLDSQPTDPPDVLNLQSSINKLRELINTNQLTVSKYMHITDSLC